MISNPFFKNPVTDFCFLLTPHYRDYPNSDFCTKLESQFLDCLEAYGLRKSKEKCADLLYDIVECSNSTFQKQRAHAIRQERMRKYRAGQLKKPFDEYPQLESILQI